MLNESHEKKESQMVFRFRDEMDATSGFGPVVVDALRRSSSRSCARKIRQRQFFLYDNPESLQAFAAGLKWAVRKQRVFHPQCTDLEWALRQSSSMLLVIHGGTLHILCSQDKYEFEELNSKPKQLTDILDNFRGVRTRYRYGHLSVVAS